MRKHLIVVACAAALLFAAIVLAQTGDPILSVDHYVGVKSTVPSISGQMAEIYVHERTKASTVAQGAALADRVVVFVHGAGTPAEVAFDVAYQDFSWMAYLAHEGYDVFSLDVTGIGRSTRPAAMNDPCNLSAAQQKLFIPSLLAAPCAPTYPGELTTIASDWNDIDAVVNYVRALRHVDRVSMIGWSLGGPRAGGYAGQHPDKVQKLVLLAPAYNRTTSADAPAKLPAAGAAFNTQSRSEFIANWDRQVGCPAQYDAATANAVWSQMLESDPVGATWGTGVRRASLTTTWGWTQAMVAKTQIPTLLITGAHDAQVQPQRVRELFDDLGTRQKVLIDLGCSSHNAMWEKNHTILFRASLEWLEHTSVNGIKEGALRLGY